MIPLDTFLLLNVPYGTDGTWYELDMGWTISNEEAGADGTGALERTAAVILKESAGAKAQADA